MTPPLLLLALCLALCACAARAPVPPEPAATLAEPLDPAIKPLAKEQDEQISE